MIKYHLLSKIVNIMEPSVQQKSERNLSVLLKDIPGSCLSVSPGASVNDVAGLLKKHQDVSGIMILDGTTFMGIIARERMFEVLGRPYGVELYRNKSIIDFCTLFGTTPMIFEGHERVESVVMAALNRNPVERYHPVIVSGDHQTYQMVDMYTLLTKQNQLLTGLYEEVRNLSIIDPLTRVYNRRGFHDICQVIQTQLNSLSGQIISVLMIDIDHFKLVNDTYGHIAGDMVLQSVAGLCKSVLREKDVIVRYGGEEFCILLLDTDQFHAKSIADRLKTSVFELISTYEESQIRITISIGVTTSSPVDTNLDGLILQSDKAMFRAKQKGRNQTHLYSNEDDEFLENRAIKKNQENMMISAVYEETIQGWVRALELRDKETEGHAQRVAQITVDLAKKLGFTDPWLEHIRRGALLHDIGKMAIPDEILFKPGKLTPEEWAVMRQHPVYAYQFLSPINYLAQAIDIPYYHHEHWDGSGYPRGLRGEDIPLTARIFTIVDVWDALKSNRCYRSAWEDDQVLEYLRDQSGQIFDPRIVEAFLEILDSPVKSDREEIVHSSVLIGQ
jgi:diguanylate cyclase (GGDEF)-like protein/putative nucleotidyltransferase with HDIG domain